MCYSLLLCNRRVWWWGFIYFFPVNFSKAQLLPQPYINFQQLTRWVANRCLKVPHLYFIQWIEYLFNFVENQLTCRGVARQKKERAALTTTTSSKKINYSSTHQISSLMQPFNYFFTLPYLLLLREKINNKTFAAIALLVLALKWGGMLYFKAQGKVHGKKTRVKRSLYGEASKYLDLWFSGLSIFSYSFKTSLTGTSGRSFGCFSLVAFLNSTR